jgi:hypothetical protein
LTSLRFSYAARHHEPYLISPGLKRPTHQFGVRDLIFH